jgi:hypothetical protein
VRRVGNGGRRSEGKEGQRKEDQCIEMKEEWFQITKWRKMKGN